MTPHAWAATGIFFAVAAATFAVFHIGYVVTRAIEYAPAEDES